MAEPLWDNNKGLRLLPTNSDDYLFLEPAPNWVNKLQPFMELKEVNATWNPEAKGWVIPMTSFPHINYFLEAVGDLDTPELDSPGYLPDKKDKAPVRMLNFQEFKLLGLLLQKDNAWFAKIYTPRRDFAATDLERWLYYPFKTVRREDLRDAKQWGSTQFVEAHDPLKPHQTMKPAGVDWIPEEQRISNLSDAFVDALAHTQEQLDIESRYIHNRGRIVIAGGGQPQAVEKISAYGSLQWSIEPPPVTRSPVYDPSEPVTLDSGNVKRYTFIYTWGPTTRSVEYSNNKDVFLYDGHQWIPVEEDMIKPLPPQFTCPLPFPVMYFTSGVAPLDSLNPSVNPDFEGKMEYNPMPRYNEELQNYYETNERKGIENVSAVRLSYENGALLTIYVVSTLASLQPDEARVRATLADPTTVYIGMTDDEVSCKVKLTPEEETDEREEEILEEAETDYREDEDVGVVEDDTTEEGEPLPADEYMPSAAYPWEEHGQLQPVQVRFPSEGKVLPVVGGLSPLQPSSPLGAIELPASQSPRGLPPIQMNFPNASPRPVVGGLSV